MKESVRDEANDSQVQLPFWKLHSCGSYECLKPWLEGQTNIKLGYHDTIRKVLKHRCFNCPHIVHLNLICMIPDQKKGRGSNSQFDF
jgi:hypothetical protein